MLLLWNCSRSGQRWNHDVTISNEEILLTTILGSLMRKLLIVAALGAALLLGACAQQGTVTERTPVVLFPELPQQPRIQFLMAISSEESLDPEAGKSGFRDFVVGEDLQKQVQRLVRPFALGSAPGLLYVLDKKKNIVTRIDLATGKFRYLDDMRGGLPVQPNSIFVDVDGWVYVADQGRREILVYNERGEFETSYATGDDTRPVDVAATKDRVYAVDVWLNQVLIFDKLTGEQIDVFGGVGTADGLFQKPTHIALTADNRIAITDMLNARVQLFDSDGNFLKKFGEMGIGRGAVVRPKGIDVDRSDNLYLVDAAFEMLTIFDLDTKTPRMSFGKVGRPGGTYLPQDVLIDYDNVGFFQKKAHPYMDLEYIVFVANGWNSVSVYGFGNWTGPLDESAARQIIDKITPNAEQTIKSLEEIEGAEDPSQ